MTDHSVPHGASADEVAAMFAAAAPSYRGLNQAARQFPIGLLGLLPFHPGGVAWQHGGATPGFLEPHFRTAPYPTEQQSFVSAAEVAVTRARACGHGHGVFHSAGHNFGGRCAEQEVRAADIYVLIAGFDYGRRWSTGPRSPTPNWNSRPPTDAQEAAVRLPAERKRAGSEGFVSATRID